MGTKRQLDDTDLDILDLLAEDSRQPYSEIAEAVGLSPPAVSDRVDRLAEQGIIRQFTIDIDRQRLRAGGTPVVLLLESRPGRASAVYEAVRDLEGVEHAFETQDGIILVHGEAPEDVEDWLRRGIEMDALIRYDLHLLARHDWSRRLGDATFALTCAVCGNTVDSEGVTAAFDGETVAFCCPSCKETYEQRYETHKSER
jgi:Lrp/AsnC family leucine-responsive transcriptional regulator